MRRAIVLAMHGVPANDFPRGTLHEFHRLHVGMEEAKGDERAAMRSRFADLDFRIRIWPRTEENDPYHAASQRLSEELRQKTGYPVFLGFNEFCAPSLEDALYAASSQGAEQIFVVTSMVTPGGEHSERDILGAIEKFREKHPDISVQYAWPFDLAHVARFLGEHLSSFINNGETE